MKSIVMSAALVVLSVVALGCTDKDQSLSDYDLTSPAGVHQALTGNWVLDTAYMDENGMEYNDFVASLEYRLSADGTLRYFSNGEEMRRSQWTVTDIQEDGIITYSAVSLREREEGEPPAETTESWMRIDGNHMILMASPEGPDLGVYRQQ